MLDFAFDFQLVIYFPRLIFKHVKAEKEFSTCLREISSPKNHVEIRN